MKNGALKSFVHILDWPWIGNVQQRRRPKLGQPTAWPLVLGTTPGGRIGVPDEVSMRTQSSSSEASESGSGTSNGLSLFLNHVEVNELIPSRTQRPSFLTGGDDEEVLWKYQWTLFFAGGWLFKFSQSSASLLGLLRSSLNSSLMGFTGLLCGTTWAWLYCRSIRPTALPYKLLELRSGHASDHRGACPVISRSLRLAK